MADYIVNDKAESAIVALVTAAVAALDPLPRVTGGRATSDSEADDLVDGLIVCSADGEGDEEIIGMGNFWVQGMVEMKHSAVPNEDGTDPTADPLAAAQARVTAVSNAILTDTLAADLSAADTPFHVYGRSVTFEAPTREQVAQGFWVDTIKWKMLCCAADL